MRENLLAVAPHHTPKSTPSPCTGRGASFTKFCWETKGYKMQDSALEAMLILGEGLLACLPQGSEPTSRTLGIHRHWLRGWAAQRWQCAFRGSWAGLLP